MYRKNARVKTGDWERRLKMARDRRDGKASQWRENKALLLGAEGVKGFKRADLVNLAWAAFQTMIGTVYSQNPKPLIREKKAALQQTAKMLTDIVKSDLQDMRSRYVTRLAMADVFWAGFGLVLEKLESDTTSRFYRYTVAGQTEEGEVDVPANQRYSLARVHPLSVLFDPVASFPDLSDSMWIAFEYYPTIQELRDDPMYKVNEQILKKLPRLSGPPALDRAQDTSPKWRNDRNTQAYGGAEEQDDMAQVRCYEIWNRVSKTLCHVPAGFEDKIIAEQDWPIELRINGELQFPCTMLYFNENPDELYPIPEISMIAPQLKQYAVLFKQILRESVKKFRKYLVQGALLQKGHVDALLDREQDSIISVDGTKIAGGVQVRLQDIVMPIIDPVVDRDLLAVSALVKQTVHEIVGAGDFASAGFRNTRSATEAAALSDFLKGRMTTRTENIDAFFKALITKHVLFLQQTLTEERAIMTTDENGLQIWKEYSSKDLEGNFGVDVVAGSSMPENTETRRQENIAFFQQVIPIIAQGGGNPKPMIDWISPFYQVPQHIVDQSFNNHKEALQQLTLILAMIHAGAKIPGQQLIEAASAAVNTGLSPAELQQIAAQGQAAGAAQSSGGNQPGQPGGLPGTNTSEQTL